jgi:hypothetical protein
MDNCSVTEPFPASKAEHVYFEIQIEISENLCTAKQISVKCVDITTLGNLTEKFPFAVSYGSDSKLVYN